ncbi:MAG: alpha/beta hydrolase-fold protein [Planctomycetota bacterium]
MIRMLCVLLSAVLLHSAADAASSDLRFNIRFDSSVRKEALTGRVYVAIARKGRNARSPIRAAGETGVPLFGVDVKDLSPRQPVVIDDTVFGHPLGSLRDLPPGDYVVQAFVNVYTECKRSDGHTVFVHLDQGEGQNWRRSPGNLLSSPKEVQIDESTKGIDLNCDQVIPAINPIPDTQNVKRIRFQSKRLSEFWGQPIYLGATVLLPKGYDEHPDVSYPVNYIQGHFSRAAPGGFQWNGSFQKQWLSEEPQARFIYVTFQHPSPYYDDSYGVNSANNGPYGDAIMEELIPAVEEKFRVIREPWARQLSGGSTGGWIALAMQVFYPDFFGGSWASAPDSPDFRYHQLVDIYSDDNAYYLDKDWMQVERPARRRTDGNVDVMMKDENHFELVAGTRSRSGGQWDIWEATFGPCGEDGYPKRLWDKRTGEIDHEVAEYWRENYDLRYILQRDWKTLGPKLNGKLHLYCGDMDNYYLNNGLRKLKEFLDSAENPPFKGVVEFKPMAPHVWGPRSSELLERMDRHIRESAPAGAELESWHY